jgi:hypothetical protein
MAPDWAIVKLVQPYVKYLTWAGGSMLSSLPTFAPSWMTKVTHFNDFTLS